MKYYIATKLENHEQHNQVRDMLAERGHEITYDWTVHGPVWSEGLDRCREVAMLETQGVVDADVVIVLWPGGRGTHAELGIALGCGKMVIFVSDVAGHHEASPDVCAFYYHELVDRCRSIDEIPQALYFVECLLWERAHGLVPPVDMLPCGWALTGEQEQKYR